jgi:hypothetical protein
MGVAQRIHEVDEVPEPSSYQSQRQRQRAIKVARVSRRGRWAAYAKSKNRQTLYTIVTRINAREEWRGLGTLEARYVKGPRAWTLFLSFRELRQEGFARNVEATPVEDREFDPLPVDTVDEQGTPVPDDDEPATEEELAVWAEIERRRMADREG